MLGHPRSAHRANPGGGLPLLTRQAPTRRALTRRALTRRALTRRALARQAALPAQHRQPRATAQHSIAQRRAPREPQQALQLVMSGLGALIVTAIVGLSAFFIVADELRGPGGESAAPPGVSTWEISSRAVDAAPLTQDELFPDLEIHLSADGPPYRVTMTHIDSDCRIASTGELSALLNDQGCSQVVRASMIAPFRGYLVTAGIFNLAEESGATLVDDRAGALVESGRGSFTPLGGLGGNPLAEPLVQVAWHHRGHFLLYCVIARPDGQLVADDDPYARRIVGELIEQYLAEDVLGERTSDP